MSEFVRFAKCSLAAGQLPPFDITMRQIGAKYILIAVLMPPRTTDANILEVFIKKVQIVKFCWFLNAKFYLLASSLARQSKKLKKFGVKINDGCGNSQKVLTRPPGTVVSANH